MDRKSRFPGKGHHGKIAELQNGAPNIVPAPPRPSQPSRRSTTRQQVAAVRDRQIAAVTAIFSGVKLRRAR